MISKVENTIYLITDLDLIGMTPLHILEISSGVLVKNILETDLLKILKYRKETFVSFKKLLKNSTQAKFYDKIKYTNLILLKI